MSDITTERTKEIVVKTLREAAFWDIQSELADTMTQTANEIENMTTQELMDRACCPMCEEVICDTGCPLECVPRNQ